MSKHKVLIIDDETELASTLAERLQLRGYEAQAVFSAEDGMEAIRDLAPEVVILDLNLPGEGGLALMKKIKASFPAPEVILATGHGETESEEEGLSDGAFAYIIKPFDITGLLGKVEGALAANRAF